MPETIQKNYNPSDNYPRPNNELTKSQKIAVAVLAFFAIFIVILWSYQFRKTLTSPFDRTSKQTNNNQNAVCPNGKCNELSEEDMRKKDTDKDGLNDFDELNVYKTSPFLDDSDSDGFSDKQEIDSGNDPNCPIGRDCIGETTIASSTRQSNSVNQSANSNPTALNGEMDAVTLRKLLIDSGTMDEATLNQISDEELLKTYNESLNSN
jgi:hypothetical protein